MTVDSCCFLECLARVSGSHYHIETTGDHGRWYGAARAWTLSALFYSRPRPRLAALVFTKQPAKQPAKQPSHRGETTPSSQAALSHPHGNAKLLQISISTIHCMQNIFALFNINHYHMEWVCIKHFTAIHFSTLLSEYNSLKL